MAPAAHSDDRLPSKAYAVSEDAETERGTISAVWRHGGP